MSDVSINSMPVAPEKIRLEQMLYGLDLAQLKVIAAHLGLDNSFASRARLLADIPPVLASAPADSLLEGLNRTDRYKLAALIALEKTADVVSGAYFSNCDNNIYSKGLASRGLAVMDPALGRPRVPVELIESLTVTLSRSFKLPSSGQPETPLRLSLASAVLDLTTLWVELLKRPVPLTKTGILSRRSLGRITSLLSVDEGEPPLYDIFAALGASRLDLLINCALRRRAITRRGGELVANRGFLATVVSGFPGLEAELLAEVVPETGAAAALSLYVINEHPGGRWFKFSDLARFARRANAEWGTEASATVVCALFSTGALEAGFVEGEPVFARVSEIDGDIAAEKGENAQAFLVGGNFEVQVPSDIPQAERLKLEAFADLKASGHYLTYTLTRDSYYRALDDGLKPEEVIDFLKTKSAKELPQNLVFSLEDWAGRYGAVGFVEGTFLLADDEDRLDEIARVTKLVGGFDEPLKMYGFRIKTSDYETVYQRLIEAGFLPSTLAAWERESDAPRVCLFRGETDTPLPAARSAAVSPEEMLKSAVAFACEKNRRMCFYLSNGDTAEGVPVKPVGKRSRKVEIETEDGLVKVALAEIEGFEFV